MSKFVQLLPLALLCACSTPEPTIAEDLTAIWQTRERDGSRWARAINFTGDTVNGTDTALIFSCLGEDPHIMVQHGEIDDDDTTWKQRGTKEDVTLNYKIDDGEWLPIRGFLDGLDSSDVFLYPEDEPAFLKDILSAEYLGINIGPAMFSRPSTPAIVYFVMDGANEEIGDTLSECGIGG